jgi:hypothetical protein
MVVAPGGRGPGGRSRVVHLVPRRFLHARDPHGPGGRRRPRPVPTDGGRCDRPFVILFPVHHAPSEGPLSFPGNLPGALEGPGPFGVRGLSGRLFRRGARRVGGREGNLHGAGSSGAPDIDPAGLAALARGGRGRGPAHAVARCRPGGRLGRGRRARRRRRGNVGRRTRAGVGQPGQPVFAAPGRLVPGRRPVPREFLPAPGLVAGRAGVPARRSRCCGGASRFRGAGRPLAVLRAGFAGGVAGGPFQPIPGPAVRLFSGGMAGAALWAVGRGGVRRGRVRLGRPGLGVESISNRRRGGFAVSPQHPRRNRPSVGPGGLPGEVRPYFRMLEAF